MVVYKNSTRKLSVSRDSSSISGNILGKSTSSPNSRKGKLKTRESTRKQSMLNARKLAPFKYDMNEILSKSQMSESKASAFLASLIAKASRQFTKEAKNFTKTYFDDGYLTKDEFDNICRLIDKYSKYR